MTPVRIDIDETLEGTRLDMLLVARHPERSRTSIQKAIDGGCATINGERGKSGIKLELGDCVEYALPDEEAKAPLQAEEIPLDILYEDNAILVINKPAGLVVHPAAGNESGTLVSGLLFREPEAFAEVGDDTDRPGIVHRLDKDTSGVLVIARTPQAHAALKQSFQERQVDKIYLAMASRHFKDSFGVVEEPIGRDPRHRQKMSVLSDGGREALTKYRVIAERNGASLLQVRLYTGRTHQIRVHLSHIGHPILGDGLYGGPRKLPPFSCERQMLHAWKIAIPHPVTGERIIFTAPAPADFQKNLDLFAEVTDLTGLV